MPHNFPWVTASAFFFCLCEGCHKTDPPEQLDDTDNTALDGEYEFLYDDQRIVDVRFVIDEDDLKDLLNHPEQKQYVKGSFIYDDERIDDVGIRTKGNSSLGWVQQSGSHRFSFKVDIHEFVDQEFHGIDKMNFHNGFKDPSYLREKTAYDLFREAGVHAPYASYVNLYVNDELYGLYTNIEQVDKDFLAHRFSNNSGNLYKPQLGDGALLYRGDEPSDYNLGGLGLKTNEEEADYSRIIKLITVINHSHEPDFPEQLESIFDVESFLWWLALNSLMVNLDSYAGEGHNYYLYDDPQTKRFFCIPWDANEAFGNFCCQTFNIEGIYELDVFQPVCFDYGQYPLIKNILEVSTYRIRYESILTELMGSIFSEDDLVSRLTDTHSFIDDAVDADPLKLFSYEEFLANLHDNIPGYNNLPQYPEDTILGLTPLVEERLESVEEQVSGS